MDGEKTIMANLEFSDAIECWVHPNMDKNESLRVTIPKDETQKFEHEIVAQGDNKIIKKEKEL